MSDSTVLHKRLTSVFSSALNRDVPSVDADLFETGVLDSLAFVELLLHLEQEFGVATSVDDMEVENFRSIACIADFVMARSAVPTPSAGQKIVELRTRR
jgi:D-alanine--poly(phosphoribitol) ligase subunit 2